MPPSDESGLYGKVHFNIEDLMTFYPLLADGDYFIVFWETESHSGIFNFIFVWLHAHILCLFPCLLRLLLLLFLVL